MNENHENNTGSGKTATPFTKRIAKFSAFIYLGLAITVVIVATVGIFSISYDSVPDTLSVSFPEASLGDFSIPQIIITPDDIGEDTPALNDESGVNADVSSEPSDESTESVPPDEPTFFRPVQGEILKNYSMDKLIFSETMKDYRVHSGIDLAACEGEDVICFADGIVESVTDDYFFGTTVAISHSDGTVSYYMNLSPDLDSALCVGECINAGDRIGCVGNTARAESAQASHLHFELRCDGALVNPAERLP